jgi:hypothetical protein
VDVLYCSIRSIVLRTIDVLENNRIRHLHPGDSSARSNFHCLEFREEVPCSMDAEM